MEIKDRGKIIQVPAGYLVIAFTCKGCKLEFSSRLVEGQPVGQAFGKCPRCKGEGLVVHAALDHDKVAALFKEQEESRSDPDTFSEEFSKELREAEDEVKKGKSITRDELSKRMESWKE